MIYLTIRTDKPEAEIGLFDGSTRLAYETWQAHRELAETIHSKLDALLRGQNKSLADIQGIAAYQGPGSFTGLRIGLTVANALAYACAVPVTAASGDNWAADALKQLEGAKRSTSKQYVLPEYGGEANITAPRK